jgi:hypothetical protein
MSRDGAAPRSRFRVVVWSAVALTAIWISFSIYSSCTANSKPLPTVAGPETNDLINRATGCVVVDHPVAGIDAVRLQDLRKLAVRQPHDETDAIYLLAGPDAEGWVAFVTDNMEAKTHSLKVIKMDGTGEEEVFTAPGDALWDNPMSTPALAPRGGSVAFLTQPVRSFAPRIESGPIEVWNIHTKKEQDTNIEALNRGLSWFPDGKHFTYVQVQPGEPEMVYILNVENGERKLLHTGRNAMVSTDGESVLVNTAEEGNIVVDVKTGESKKVQWPGNWRGPVALIGKDLLLYWGLPTTGTIRGSTENNSPLVGPKPLGTLKLADLSSGEFQTVRPYVDPRREVSFGITSACP